MGMIETITSGPIPTPIGPLSLMSMSRECARSRTRMSRLDISGRGTLMGESVQWTNLPVDDAVFEAATIVKVRANDVAFQLVLAESLTEFLADLGSQHAINEALDKDMAALAIEHLLTNDLEMLEAEHAVRIEIQEVITGATFDTADAVLRVGLRHPVGADLNVYVRFDSEEKGIAAIERTYPAKPARELPQVKIPACIVGPLAIVSRRQVLGAGIGDVVAVCPDWLRVSDHLNLMIRNSRVVPLRRVDNGVQAIGTGTMLDELKQSYSNGNEMTSSDQDNNGSAMEPTTIVSVEITRVELSVSELSLFQSGDVLDFDIDKIETVTLCADGAPVAEGRLVKLDDSYGVQINKLL